jgi:hypothetical protein
VSFISSRVLRGSVCTPDACTQARSGRRARRPDTFLIVIAKLTQLNFQLLGSGSASDKRRVMSHKFLPKVTISSSDRRQLDRLVSNAMSEVHPVAPFLAQELARAKVVSDDSHELDSVVTMGSSVSYALNWSSPTEARALIYQMNMQPTDVTFQCCRH